MSSCVMMAELLLLCIRRVGVDQSQAQPRAYADRVPASKHLILQFIVGCPVIDPPESSIGAAASRLNRAIVAIGCLVNGQIRRGRTDA